MSKRVNINCTKCNATYSRWPYEVKNYDGSFICKPCRTSYDTVRQCLNCKKEFSVRNCDPKKFCSQTCSAVLNNKKRGATYAKTVKESRKKLICIDCKNVFNAKIQLSASKAKCDICREKDAIVRSSGIKMYVRRTTNCKWCGQEVKGYKVHPQCRYIKKIYTSLKHFNDIRVGTVYCAEDIEGAIDILKNEYQNGTSVPHICEKYGYPDPGTLSAFMKRNLNMSLRSASAAGREAYKQGRLTPSDSQQFQCGEHITWDCKTVRYRSSYELDYYKILDLQHKRYEVEPFRIQYYDTIKCVIRTAIPDIYLIDENKIIEIKSKYTYDAQNMKDKVKAYHTHGYNFTLILDKEEHNIEY